MKRIENQCQGKIPYQSKELANQAVKHLNKVGGKRVKTYKCNTCHKYHFGHESKGKLQYKDKKVINYIHEPGIHKIKIDE